MRSMEMDIGGVKHKVQEVQWEIVKEDWNEYKLMDGGRVRLKTTVQKIFRILNADGSPGFTPGGDPNVFVRHSAQVVTQE